MKVKLISKTPNLIDTIYTAARTCYNPGSPIDMWEDISTISEDRKLKLIGSCIKSGHLSVLEHSQLTFAIQGVSRALLAQISRHRIGVSLSVQSQRYVNLSDTFDYVIPKGLEKDTQEQFKEYMSQAHENYVNLIKKGLKAEDARAVLPNACCTNMVITLNIRSFIHLCSERLCSKSQAEIRSLVTQLVKETLKDNSWLQPYLQPKCVYIGYCQEHNGCGRKPCFDNLVNK